jgi:hypothetical protein
MFPTGRTQDAGKDARRPVFFSPRKDATTREAVGMDLPLLLPFPNAKQPEPARAQLNQQERVEILAARVARGEPLWCGLDWCGHLDPTAVNDRLAWAGEDRRANGTDKPAEPAGLLGEYADDELPYPSWEEDLAAWRGLRNYPDATKVSRAA